MLPDEEQEQGQGQDQTADQTAQDQGAEEQPGSSQNKDATSSDDALVRPEGLPDDFWSDTDGVLLPDLITKFTELTGAQAERDVAAQGIPDKPEGYALPDLEVLGLPEGSEIELDDNHPLLGPAREFAHANGLSQENFAGMVGLYVQGQARELEQLNEFAKVEREKLGRER